MRYVDLNDLLLVLGVGLVVYGLSKIYVPAAYIAPGIACIYLAVTRRV